MRSVEADLLIIGGGFGGCAAALSACEQNLDVYLAEPTEWIGGQVTSQGVPPDEHEWMEDFGRTARYQNYRERVRESYRRMFDVEAAEPFNPGNGIVSNLCHDPRVTLQVLKEMLLPYELSGKLTIATETQLIRAERQERQVGSVTFTVKNGEEMIVHAGYIIDASEEGELLPLAGMDYVIGAESKNDTGEPHAREEKDESDIQAFTYVLGMEYREGESHVIEKPDMYDFWKTFRPDFWPGDYLSFHAPHPVTGEKRKYTLLREEDGFPLWEYRRSFDKTNFPGVSGSGDVTLMNWPMNDYFLGNVYEVSEEEKQKHLYQSKQLSLSLMYWLQTEAPRHHGGTGYPELKLRTDMFDTADGLAKYPYIREARRIIPEYRVVEQDVSPQYHEGVGQWYEDVVGIGSYSIDLHPRMSGHGYLDIPALPFHIPLGALLPQDVDNVMAGGKNVGVTHLTNGCFRLHPVEWNIGEAAGELAAFCIAHQVTPKQVRKGRSLLEKFQMTLTQNGVELEWPEHFYSAVERRGTHG